MENDLSQKVSVKKYKKWDIEDEIKQLEELKKENKILWDVKINADWTYTYIKSKKWETVVGMSSNSIC